MNILHDLASNEEGTPEETLEKIAHREGLVYFDSEKNQLVPTKNWRLEEAKSLKGQQNYYYSIIKGTENYSLPVAELFTYDQYLSKSAVFCHA